MISFLGQYPIKYKIFVDNKSLKVKNFKYLGCEISCDKGKGYKKTSKCFSNIGNSKQNFLKNSDPEISKNKCIKCTSSPHSFILNRNFSPWKKK